MRLKKILSLLTVTAMLLSCAGITVLAEEAEGTAVPTGSITAAYTSTNVGKPFWGEATANSTTSFEVKLYEGENVIASTVLQNYEGIIDGDVTVTWSFRFENDSEYWVTTWADGYPTASMKPDKVVLYSDGVPVAENVVKFNAPDDLNKIYAAANDKNGKFIGYFTTLSDAMGKFNGREVVVLRDVTESISGMYGCTLTTNVDGGVTITDTNTTDWINFDDVTVEKGVNVVIAKPYVGDSVSVIKGSLLADGVLYIGYDGKLIVQDGGSVVVNDSVINRYHTEADSGIYIYGDGNDETVEFTCGYYIGSYSGTFYAENANIETGYFLLQHSYDEAYDEEKGYELDADMTLVNSTVTVVGTSDTQDSFIIDSDVSLTMTNSKIVDVRDFSILAGTNLTLTMDSASSISATNMSIADDVPLAKITNADGTFGVSSMPNATVTVLEPLTLAAGSYKTWPSGATDVDRPLEVVMNFKANDSYEEAQASSFAKWKTDFYLKVTGLSSESITADNCYLAGNYGTYGWIVIPTDETVIEEGVSYPIVSNYDAKLTYENICDYVKDFTAAIHIDSAILKENPNLQVTLSLKMTDPDDATNVIVIGEPATYTAEDLMGEEEEEPYIFGKAFYMINLPMTEDGKYQVGLYAGIDSLKYKEVGFKIYNEAGTLIASQSTNTVYTSVKGNNMTMTAENIGSYRIYGANAIFSTAWDGIPVIFQPYAVDLNGNDIFGYKYKIPDIYTKTE